MKNFWEVLYRSGSPKPGGDPLVGHEVLHQTPYARVEIQPAGPAPQTSMQASPPSPPGQQSQPISVGQPPVQTQKASEWRNFFDTLKDPNVFGPLMTFVQAATVPLSPGETLGGRLAYASSLMQMHKRLLEENAQRIPEQALKARKEQLELENLESQVQRNKMLTQTAERYGMAVEAAKLRNLLAQGRLDEAKAAAAEIANKLETKYGEASREADIRYKQANTRYLDRLPQQAVRGNIRDSSLLPTQQQQLQRQQLMQEYDQLIGIPYAKARQEALKQGIDLSFDDYLQQSGKNVLFRQFIKKVDAHNAVAPQYRLEWRQQQFTESGRGNSPAKKRISAEQWLQQND